MFNLKNRREFVNNKRANYMRASKSGDKRRRIYTAILIAILLVVTFCAGCGAKSPVENASEDEDSIIRRETAEILASMSLEQKIEQMIMPAFRSYKSDNEKQVTEVDDYIRDFIKNHRLGGVILFSENISGRSQTAAFNKALQEANAEGGSPTGLLIAVDQEGGSITRITMGCQTPGNMALGASDEANAASAGTLIGEELFVQGFNMDFAPVLDVNVNPSNPIIGVRSFSDNPERVGQFGKAFLQGLHSANIITTIKHFPGHGDTDTDSHTGLPSIDKTLEQLKECELIPFEMNCEETDLVMTAHIQFPQIEREKYTSKQSGEEITLPATLSKTIITGILRDEMGFHGVITTDAMNMDAIASHFEPLDAARLAINAGVDLLLMPTSMVVEELDSSLSEYVAGIAAMVKSGEISEERIDESAGRIISLKIRNGIMPDKLPAIDPEEAVRVVGSKEHHEREWDIALSGITIVKSDTLPPVSHEEKIALAVPYESEMNSISYGVLEYMEYAKETIGRDYDASGINIICYEEIQEWDLDAFVEGVDVVIGISALYGESELDPNSEDGIYTAFLDKLMAKAHEKGKRFVLISAQLPYDIARFTDADVIMACYSARGMMELPEASDDSEGSEYKAVKAYGPNLPAAIYTALGGNKKTGTLPVDIPRINEDYTYSDEILYERGTGLSYDE